MKLRGGEFSTGTTGIFQPELTKHYDGEVAKSLMPYKRGSSRMILPHIGTDF